MRSRVPAWTCVVAMLIAACGGSEAATTTTAPTPATSSTTITAAPTTTTTQAADRLPTFIEKWSETTEQGVVLVVAPADGEPHPYAAGFADPEVGTAITPDDLFYIGSITKPVVSTVVMQLVDEGLVDLDATVDTYLPDVLPGESVTVRDVLSHQSGVFDFTLLPDFASALAVDPFQEITPQEVTDAALERDRLRAPGQLFSYSNTNYLIAGFIVEAVTGNSLAEELESRVYSPLGIEEMRFAGQEGRSVVNGFADFDGDFQLEATEPFLDSTTYTVAWGAGGLAATASELATFAAGAFGGTLLSADSIATMTSVAASEYTGEGYGLGVLVGSLRGEPVWGHGGAIPGYTSQFYYFPADGLVLVALSNGEKASVAGFLEAAAGIVREG